MKEASDRESERSDEPKLDINWFYFGFWAVEFLSKFQPDPTDGSKVTPLFVKSAQDHIASLCMVNISKHL